MASIIAVAGGTGDVGRTIVEAILADGKFPVVILSRNADEDREKGIGACILPVDYSSADNIARTLGENDVHTVISTLNNMASVQPELNLTAAADQAVAVKRYVPSIWGAIQKREMPIIKLENFIIAALEKTNVGFLACHLTSMAMVVDVVNNQAGIPESGDVPVAITFTSDLAKFVAAALTRLNLEQETYLTGDKLAWNQLVELAEAVKGITFDVFSDSIETLKAGLMFERGVFDLKGETTITQNFSDFKLRSMKELLEEAYKLKV